MIYAMKNKEVLKNLKELEDLQSKVKPVRLVEKRGKQRFHYDIREIFEPVTDTLKNTSEDITKTITETSIKNNKALENLNEKVSELMNDKAKIALHLASSLVKLFKPENKSQFKLTNDLSSTKMNEFLIQGIIPVTLYSRMLTFRESNKSFNLDGDLLKTMKNYIFSAGHSNLQDQKIFREIAENMKFDI